jgi:hypothetical protein
VYPGAHSGLFIFNIADERAAGRAVDNCLKM